MNNYKVQRCRSHEVNSTPMAWETVYEATTAADVIRELRQYERYCRASGDLFRIVDSSGLAQVIISDDECVAVA